MKSSMGIHVKKCADKFKAESKNYGLKRKVPKAPEELEQVSFNLRSSTCQLYLNECLRITTRKPSRSTISVV